MSETKSVTPNESSESETPYSVVDTVFDAALAWADTGLGKLKKSLSDGGKALIRGARTIQVVRERLRA